MTDKDKMPPEEICAVVIDGKLHVSTDGIRSPFARWYRLKDLPASAPTFKINNKSTCAVATFNGDEIIIEDAPTTPHDKVAEAVAWLKKEMARGFYSMPEDQQTGLDTLVVHAEVS